MAAPPNMNQETLRRILEFLWQRHLHSEHVYLYYVLLAPLVGLTVFLVLWSTQRAHVYSLLDAITFFFAPRGPSRMLVFKDLLGKQHVFYEYNVVKAGKGYVLQAGPFILRTEDDPEAYAYPVSLLDARGPPGVPSPYGVWARQLVASFIVLVLVTVAFSNSFYVTATVYAKYLGVPYTTTDLVAFAGLVLTLAWFIVTLLRVLAPQTMLVTLAAYEAQERSVGATPALDVYSPVPPAKLLKSIKREPRIIVSSRVARIIEELREEFNDTTLAATILALLGQVYSAWKRSVGVLLKDRYDISVAARAKYQLEEEKIPKGFLNKYAGALAIIAIVLVVVGLIVWLGPSVHPATATNATNATVGGGGYYTPAPPPTPHITHQPPPATPAPPPTPPFGGGK